MTKIFVDGSVGTTGLRIVERLQSREDIALLTLPESLRKDVNARRDMLNRCDGAVLCLPDVASIEAVSLLENPAVKVFDASTAHRTNPDWAYGFAELGDSFRQNIETSHRIAVPGCHASGFIALVKPLIDAGILPQSTLFSCHSITGYSGGGKSMIGDYEKGEDSLLLAPRQYGITQNHKHLKEMKHFTGIEQPPVFSPIVAPFYSGMEVTVPLFGSQLASGFTKKHVEECYQNQYTTKLVTFCPDSDESGFLSAGRLSMKDNMEITVCGNEERMVLVARYDNLGKGASGAAVACMNIAFGMEETTGLDL